MASRDATDDTLRLVLVIVAALVLAPMVLMVVAFPLMGLWGGAMLGGSWVWGLGMMLVWVVVLVGGGYLVYRGLSGGRGIRSDPALEELRLAYARGEIDEDEFEERLSRLSGD